MFVKEYVKKEKNIQTEMVTVNANINVYINFIKFIDSLFSETIGSMTFQPQRTFIH